MGGLLICFSYCGLFHSFIWRSVDRVLAALNAMNKEAVQQFEWATWNTKRDRSREKHLENENSTCMTFRDSAAPGGNGEGLEKSRASLSIPLNSFRMRTASVISHDLFTSCQRVRQNAQRWIHKSYILRQIPASLHRKSQLLNEFDIFCLFDVLTWFHEECASLVTGATFNPSKCRLGFPSNI